MASSHETASASGTIQTNPLDLPEIRDLIAPFLGTRELASCSRVSRSWHASFQPHVWSELNLPLVNIDQLEDFRTSLQRNGHWVRRLRAAFMNYAQAMAHLQMALSSCRQLQQLRIIRRWDGVYEFGNTAVVFDPQYWQDLTALISQNPELKVIGFNLCCRVEFPATFWRAIANVPQIQTLSIHGAVINGQETEVVDAFLDACLAVESLHLDYTLFKEPIRSERWANCKRFPRLAILNFFGRTLLDMDFFAKCLAAPGLKRVRWSTEHSDKYLPSTMASQVSQHIVNARLGSLTGLELWDGMPFTDEDICAVLDSFTSPLIELSVSESGFGEMSLASLLRQPSLQNTTQNMLGQGESSTTLDVRYGQRAPHCTKLQIIDLTDCPDVTDEMAELIRESCPHLKTLFLK